jgi:hypothetical protein
MSRSHKHTKHHNPDDPYWKYGWAYNKAPKAYRKIRHRRFRQATRLAIIHGNEPPHKEGSAAWDYW